MKIKLFNFYNEYIKKNYIIIPLENITLCITHEKICLYDLNYKDFKQNFKNIKELDLYELIFNKEYEKQKKYIYSTFDITKDNCEFCNFYEKCPMKRDVEKNKDKINDILKELRELIKNNSEID